MYDEENNYNSDEGESIVKSLNPVVNLYNIHQYKFESKEKRLEKETSVNARLQRMEQVYEEEGLRRSVEGILLVHEHNHPHILLLQIGNTFFKLPGGKLRAGESEIEGLKRKLDIKLSPVDPNSPERPVWEIGDVVAVWWRPNFETLMVSKTFRLILYFGRYIGLVD
eukprot:TRINITY_DN573_c0_g1_i2.p1 TRINITY_DN573_c0_g1~~TRINITY_DN573_c0_g1_i2.p1  ORF type:complete len:175 (+),score=31.60 TRINITY_DN573_c0_g1_i2:25-525(+)